MRFSYNGWKSVIRIVQIAVGSTILFFSFNHGLVQKVHYSWFKINQADYKVIEADIIDRKTYKFIQRRDMEVMEIICAEISYTIDDNNYVKWIYSYPDMIDKEKIKIGVHVRNPKKVLRCEPYKISIYEIKAYGLLFFGIILLMVLDSVSYKIHIYREKNAKLENTQKIIPKEELEKQEIILSRIQECSCLEQELQQKIMYYKNKGLLFNEGTLWLLKKYSNSEEIKAIFSMSPLIDKDKYFSFLNEMYEQGLPESYYVLERCDENYYCCCKESERLYMYSRAIGITNTPYETVYDYIIEQIDKR